MKEKFSALYAKEGTKKVISSLISILAGLLVGGIVVIVVGAFNSKISGSGIWDGIRLIFAGILNTGRDATGALSWAAARDQGRIQVSGAHADRAEQMLPVYRRG